MIESEKMFQLADLLKDLRDSKKDLEQQLKQLNTEIEAIDYRLAEAMTESETQNFTRAGTMFCLTTTIRASAMADRKENLYGALRAEGWSDNRSYLPGPWLPSL